MPEIIYNGYSFPTPFNKFGLTITPSRFSLTCEFLITASTQDGLVSACAAAEAACREKYKDFTLKLNNATSDEYSFKAGDNTGFLQAPTLTKLPNELSTGLSRAYRFSISGELPFTQAGYDYRRDAKISLSEPIRGRKTLSISGVYTAGGANSATDNFNTFGKPWCDSIAEEFLGAGNYELLDTSTSVEQERKILDFSRLYQEKLDLEVIYNGYTIPTSYNEFEFRHDYNKVEFSCVFAIAPASASAAEAALRVHNKNLTVSFGGTPIYNYSHSANTGMLTTPNLVKISNRSDSDLLRFYKFSVSAELPADSTDDNYRREGRYTINYLPSRQREIRFSGLYTAGGTDTAIEKYNHSTNGGKSWASSVLASLGGDFELISENVSSEHKDKLVNFTLSYREILSPESESNNNEANIVISYCTYSVDFDQIIGRSELTDQYQQIPKITISLRYSCTVDKEKVPADTGINTIYRNIVRPWLIKHSKDILGLSNFKNFGSSFFICESESYSIGTGYTVTGDITFSCPKQVDQIIHLEEHITTQEDFGVIVQKLWNGKDYNYNKTYVGGERYLNRIVTVSQLSHTPADPVGHPDQKWQLLSRSKSEYVREYGIGTPSQGLKSVLVFSASFAEKYIYIEDAILNVLY